MAMRYCKDCQLYECCMRTPLGGCQEFDNVIPELKSPITHEDALRQLHEQVDWDWEKFRREATKDILQGVLACDKFTQRIWELSENGKKPRQATQMLVTLSIKLTDELIKQLREEKK